MKKLQKLVVAILTCAMVGGLIGCGSASNEAKGSASEVSPEAESGEQSQTQEGGEKLKVGYTAYTLVNAYFTEVCKGVQDRCDELGFDLTIHDGQNDVSRQIEAIENFIAQGMDIVIVSPYDAAAFDDVLKKAHDAGIIVINGNQECTGYKDAFITVPEYEYGYTIGVEAGKWIADKLDGKAEVAVLDAPELEAVIQRANGIIDGIHEYAPDAEIVAQQAAIEAEKGMAAMETAFQAHPDIQVVVGVNDAGALGAYEAVMAAGKASDTFFVGGCDATEEALKNISDGTIYRATVDSAPYETGKLFVDTALKVQESGSIEDTIAASMKIVNTDNVGDYAK